MQRTNNTAKYGYAAKIAVAAIIGGFLNMVRGGLLAKWIKAYGKPLHHIAFGVAAWYATGDLWRGALAIPLVWAVFSLGWGRLISAAINQYIDPVAEGKKPNLMDRLCRPLEAHWLPFAYFGLTMRGAIIGLPLAALLGQWQLTMAGMSMGLCYLGAAELFRRIGKPQWAWPAGEAFYGAIIWGVMFL